VLDPYREHLSCFWPAEAIDQVEADHRQLVQAYATDPVLRSAIDLHDSSTSFDVAWDVAPGR
jgi:hypothetical protein